MWERWKTAGTIQQMLCAQFACVKTKKQIGIGSCKSPSHILDNDDNGANNFDTVDYADNVDINYSDNVCDDSLHFWANLKQYQANINTITKTDGVTSQRLF